MAITIAFKAKLKEYLGVFKVKSREMTARDFPWGHGCKPKIIMSLNERWRFIKLIELRLILVKQQQIS